MKRQEEIPMPAYRSRTSTHGRNMAGARALWRATGMKDGDFGKPIIAVVNSFTQFVPGHVHLKDLGQLVAREIEAAGGVAKEFNTIAVDDGIAMGHGGMLYSLPSRELIADSVEYMVNAHCADAMVCISNCDKITPGMLMASLRLNIPAVFVSGGPMEAGKVKWHGEYRMVDLIDAMIEAADSNNSDKEVAGHGALGLPDLRLLLGHVHRQFDELPDRGAGPVLARQRFGARHPRRPRNAVPQGRPSRVDLAGAGTKRTTPRCCRARSPVSPLSRTPSRSTSPWAARPTPCCICWRRRRRAASISPWPTSTACRARCPACAKVAPATQKYHMEDVHRAGGIMAILGELDRAGLINRDCPTVLYPTMGEALDCCDVKRNHSPSVHHFYRAAPGGVPTQVAFSQNRRYPTLDLDRANGCIRDKAHAYSKDGGLAVLYGNIAEKGCVVKTAGVDDSILKFTGRARVCQSQEEAVEKILADQIVAGDIVVVVYEGPKGGPGMQEMLYPTSYLKSKGMGKVCALLTDGRFSGGTSGLSIGHASPEAAAGGAIGLVEEGDTIEIDIPNRRIHLVIEKSALAARRSAMEARGVPMPGNRSIASARFRRRCKPMRQ
jgi:dihydroxy-acid dehydratase